MASHRLSVGVSKTASVAVPRAPCSPITNESPYPHAHVHTATKPPTSGGPVLKKIRSFTSLLHRSNAPASAQHAQPAPQPKPKKEKKPAEADPALAYGSQFAREVALLQLLDGGSTEHNIARVHKARAKAAARAGVPYTGYETGALRGPNGELFADAQEERERRGLLSGTYKGSGGRVRDDDESVRYDPSRDAAWANYQPAARKQQDARSAFFADSFAPGPNAVPVRR